MEEMDRGLHRKPANDIQLGRFAPGDLQWDDDDEEDEYDYQYDDEEYDYKSLPPEEVFLTEDPRGDSPGDEHPRSHPRSSDRRPREISSTLGHPHLAPGVVDPGIPGRSVGGSLRVRGAQACTQPKYVGAGTATRVGSFTQLVIATSSAPSRHQACPELQDRYPVAMSADCCYAT
ncbi:unnamed protein product [Phytophthora fragariaefolia]|uniref:Unnamed protein product n=1 Tax=Phytophthora fragariaefolia TaxID=1490495 RepID=A0A9W6XZT9_9STRA|nr:unnamed protein product [Phytophthora fragariaefolia]